MCTECLAFQRAEDCGIYSFGEQAYTGRIVFSRESFAPIAVQYISQIIVTILRTLMSRSWRRDVNRPGFDGHLLAVHYGIHGGGYGWQEVHDRVQG